MNHSSAASSSSVVLLTTEGPASTVLANVLSSSGLLDIIIIESVSRRRRFKWQIRHLLRYFAGLVRVRKPIRLRMPPEQRIENGLLAAAEKRVAQHYPASYLDWPSGVRRLRVDDFNGERCQAALKTRRPGVIAVFRTRILRKNVLDLAQLAAVNCHYSLLPAYRGTFVEFWQVLNGDLQTAGVTFHFVDEGVDTGDIIASFAHDDIPSDITPFDLRYRNYMLMLDHFPKVLRAVLEQRCNRQPQPPHTARAYSNNDLTDELRRQLYRRLGLLRDTQRSAGTDPRGRN